MLRTVRIFFKIANDGLGDSDCGSMRASFHSVVDGSVKADLSPALDDSARCLCHGRPDTLPCSTWRALRHLARLACSLCADVDCLLILSTAAPSGKQALILLLSAITDESNNHVVIELNTPERERERARMIGLGQLRVSHTSSDCNDYFKQGAPILLQCTSNWASARAINQSNIGIPFKTYSTLASIFCYNRRVPISWVTRSPSPRERSSVMRLL